MISIADAALQVKAAPAPVIFIDTCTFLDLFRRDDRNYPRVPAEEIRAAADLLELVHSRTDSVHLFVPELIPREYSDHATRIQSTFDDWTAFHDRNQDWVYEASLCVALALPAPFVVKPLGLAARLRSLSDDLLAKAGVLARDQTCLDQAISRLINKDRPSHKKEMKDSMNMEQCLELSGQLQKTGFPNSRIWISSNTNDFAETATSANVHPDLQTTFASAGLLYFTSLRRAIAQLRATGEMP